MPKKKKVPSPGELVETSTALTKVVEYMGLNSSTEEILLHIFIKSYFFWDILFDYFCALYIYYQNCSIHLVPSYFHWQHKNYTKKHSLCKFIFIQTFKYTPEKMEETHKNSDGLLTTLTTQNYSRKTQPLYFFQEIIEHFVQLNIYNHIRQTMLLSHHNYFSYYIPDDITCTTGYNASCACARLLIQNNSHNIYKYNTIQLSQYLQIS